MIKTDYTLKKHISAYSQLKYGHDNWSYFEELPTRIKLIHKEHGTLEDGIFFWNEGGIYFELSEKKQLKVIENFENAFVTKEEECLT
jgi:hypothetical protein